MNSVVDYLVEHETDLKKHFARRIKNVSDVDDIFQGAVLSALRYPAKGPIRKSVAALSYHVINNAIIAFYRKEPNAMLVGDMVDSGDNTAEPYTFDQLNEYQQDMARDPADIIEKEEEDDVVRNLINEVRNVKHQEVLRWYLIGRTGLRRAAQYAGLSHTNATTIVSRFREVHGL